MSQTVLSSCMLPSAREIRTAPGAYLSESLFEIGAYSGVGAYYFSKNINEYLYLMQDSIQRFMTKKSILYWLS